MQTGTDVWSAVNGIFLDLMPFAAIAALTVSWFLRRKRFDREEQAIRERIRKYRAGAGAEEPPAQKKQGLPS